MEKFSSAFSKWCKVWSVRIESSQCPATSTVLSSTISEGLALLQSNRLHFSSSYAGTRTEGANAGILEIVLEINESKQGLDF